MENSSRICNTRKNLQNNYTYVWEIYLQHYAQMGAVKNIRTICRMKQGCIHPPIIFLIIMKKIAERLVGNVADKTRSGRPAGDCFLPGWNTCPC